MVIFVRFLFLKKWINGERYENLSWFWIVDVLLLFDSELKMFLFVMLNVVVFSGLFLGWTAELEDCVFISSAQDHQEAYRI